MNHNTIFAVIGGDSRQIHMAKQLQKDGCRVSMSAFDLAQLPPFLQNKPLAEALSVANVVIFPLPLSRDAKLLNASFSKESISLHSVIQLIRPDSLVFCGMPPAFFEKTLGAHDIRVIDYFKDEELTLQNALLTAEGVIGILTDRLPCTVFGLRCAVTGYGRVAKYTARALQALGADVTIFARSNEALTTAKCDRFKAFPLQNLQQQINDLQCVINTVPALVIDEKSILQSDPDCVFIEVASVPFGIDQTAAHKHGRTLIKAVSLPGKTAPKTAGEIIAKTIENYLTEGSS
ncbi:MAG: hypothetical protein E7523_02310 [Ruminococcaceae bacterium]|nr:hypothetical protein [Oscillospiraceae bacterium]